MRSLVKAGADVNEKEGSFGFTALMSAAGAGHLEVVKALLEAGADPNASGGVAHVGFFSVLTLAMTPRNKNRVELIDTLIAGGATVNPPSWFPESPLDAAVSGRDLEMIKALLERGGVNWENEIGRTPLVTAVTSAERDADVIRLLLRAGADPNKPRLWVGDHCVSILTYLEGWLDGPRGRKTEEIMNLLKQSGAGRSRVKCSGPSLKRLSPGF